MFSVRSANPAVLASTIFAALTLSACESSTGPGTATVIRMSAPAVVGVSSETASGLSISGSNGTLVITDIKMVVNELELRRAETADCDDSSGSGTCGEFEAKYFVADVPLGSGAVTIANDRVPAGTYTALEFEVEDLESDESDDDAARIAALLTQLRTTHADWPAGASMRITGTFTPTGGAAQSFTVYVNAEVEIEELFAAPLVIDDSSTGLTIDLRLDRWFRNTDGTVRNLALNDWTATSSLLSFEVETEGHFEVEFDD